ncbi:hypothetical protein [Streptomyces sp. enrichment culture]|uniref:hypothetical protein n=1 Tax=Streptomyces sp. enrichment culture TaxID=1795815 RepID=UPI003F56BDE1
MKRRSLVLQLLQAGRKTMLSAEGGRLRFWGIGLATCLLALALSGLALAHATYEGREIRGAARAPQMLSESQRSEAVALWSWGTDDVDGRQHAVVYIEPLTSDAPLPPGLTRWPEPGEAVLSPALLKAGEREGIRTRYGTLAGTIGVEGLEAPEERFAYIRPRAKLLDKQDMHPVAAFGLRRDGIASLGESMSISDFSVFGAGLAGFTLLPAAGLVVAAVRIGSAAREKRLALFEALGAGMGSRMVFTVGEVVVPALLGLAGAAVVISPSLVTDIPFPWVDFTLSVQDARRAVPWLAAAGVAAFVVLAMAAVLLHPRRLAVGSTRPASRVQRQRPWLPWLFPFAMLFAVRGSELAGDDLRLPVYALGVAGVLATLPSVVAALTGWSGGQVARVGGKLGRPGMLVAGRRMAAQTRVTARFVAAVIVMIGLAAQAQLWTGLLGESAANAMTTRDRIGTSLVTISPYSEVRERIREFTAALPSDAGLLLARQTTPSGNGDETLAITGSCAALKSIGLSCAGGGPAMDGKSRDARIAELLRWTGGGTDSQVVAQEGRVDGAKPMAGESLTLLAVSLSGDDMSVPRLKEAARAHLGMRASAEPLGNSWLMGATDLAASGAWVRLLGLIGACLTVLAIGFTALAEFLRFGREAAPLSVLAGGNGIFGSIAAWTLLAPTLVAAVLGSVISLWLTAPITVGGRQPVPDSLYLVLAAGASMSAVLLCLWGWRSTTRLSASWRPVGD